MYHLNVRATPIKTFPSLLGVISSFTIICKCAEKTPTLKTRPVTRCLIYVPKPTHTHTQCILPESKHVSNYKTFQNIRVAKPHYLIAPLMGSSLVLCDSLNSTHQIWKFPKPHHHRLAQKNYCSSYYTACCLVDIYN